MKRYMFKLAMMSGVVVMMFSCQKSSLSPQNSTAITVDSAFNTVLRIENQAKGIYSALKSGQFLGGRYFLYNDARAENLLSLDGNRVTVRAPWEFSLNSNDDEVKNLWSAAYTTINRCNLFLEGMEKVGNNVVGAKANEYNGEARFVRALAYYSLLQFYARPYWDGNGSKPGLPLRLVAIKGPGLNADGYNNIARSTVKQVYDQILADLDFAEANLPATISDATKRTIRAHKNTAIALKTRVYLSMNDYPNVITTASKIVPAAAPFVATSGVAHALQPAVGTVYTNFTTTESILSMPFTTNDAPGTQNQLAYYYRPNFAGIFCLNPSGIIGDAGWKKVDDRRKLIDTTSSRSYLKKWTSASPYLDWAPVIRWPEVLLSLAEARARQNGVDAQAIALLNAVRQRSDASTTFTAADFADGTALVNAILKERNIEFLGEGIRSIDILRLGIAFPTKTSNGFTVSAVEPTSPAYIWPISADEIRYNKDMTSN